MAHAPRTRFERARIWTADPERPFADTMVVEGERIAWIGDRADLPDAFRGAGVDGAGVVDLGGARVVPGFVDAHMHAVMLANFSKQISALPPLVNSIEELVELVRARRFEQGPDAWVEGWGYDEELLAEHRSPTRWDLDRGCPDAPVCIMRSCGHIRCVNSRALELAGITRDTPDPEGGHIERDEQGEPTGVLQETARDLVTPFIPKPAQEDVVENLVDLGALLASQGVVAVTDMCSVDRTDTVPALTEAASRGLAQDVAVYRLWDDVAGEGSFAIPPERMDRGRQVFMAGMKLLTDGSVSGRTAWFDEPYLPSGDAEGVSTCGIPTCADEDIDDALAFCARTGCQLSMHAMGTRAIDRVLDHVEAAHTWKLVGTDAPCVRIEHVTAPSAEAVERIVREGAAVVTQPIFPYAEIASYLHNLGPSRTSRAYPLRTLVDAGATICISTDAPATSWALPSDPFPNIASAVARRAATGESFGAGEALSVEEALALYTREAARIPGFEGLGQLKAGYKASFVVLDRDILEIDPGEIVDVRVISTYIRGRCVFTRS